MASSLDHEIIFHAVKHGGMISQVERVSVRNSFFSDDDLSKFTVFSYPLIFSSDEKSKKRMRSLFDTSYREKDDEMLWAVLMGVGVYWQKPELLLDKCLALITKSDEAISDTDEWYWWFSVLGLATNVIADVANSEQSADLLTSLKALALRMLVADCELGLNTAVASVLRAATGNIWIKDNQIKPYLNISAIEKIEFGERLN